MGRPLKYATEEERKDAKAAQKRRSRENQRKEMREKEREEARERMRRFRENQNEEIREKEKEETRERMRRLRENQSEEMREENREQLRQFRENQSEEMREEERERLRRLRENQRAAKRTRLTIDAVLTEANEDENTVEAHYCGAMNVRCEFCNSKHFLAEMPQDKKFTQCCQKGKVRLNQQDFPNELKDLMTNQDPDSKLFMENIRTYNSCFAFASMGADIKAPPGNGPYCFRIQGQIYHRTGTLHPEEGEPKFAQLYILDTEDASRKRLELPENKNCNEHLMKKIGALLNDINGFAKSYRMLHEVEEDELRKADMNKTEMPEIIMAIKQDRQQDQRRYNKPRASEVAVIFENNDGEPPFNRDILVHLRPKLGVPSLKRLNILDCNLDAMVCPLFFPRAEQNWHVDLELIGANKNTRMTLMMFYSYKLSIRDKFNPLLSGGKLTQQFIVDAYVKVEANRLNWIKTHQKELRVEQYKGLVDHINDRAAEQNIPPGKMVILPSSFEGSPRNMQQRFQDAMAIVTKFGKPDFFITMTCNPKWPEILENLENYQKVEHRPDLVARVFYMKLKSLLKELDEGLFGMQLARVHSVEFQKRGLPHAHILLIVDSDSKLKTEEDIDRMVSAEIPDKNKFPILHEIVTRNMIHTPCGNRNPNSPCMVDGKCSRKFPFDFRNSTVGNRDGYPLYRRRRGPEIEVNGKKIDNSWVVPFNPYLLLKYNCHINVEVCASIQSVKYLYKYVYKGHDCANVEIKEVTEYNHDEPAKHVDSRYVSAPEAIWRIFSFPMHMHTHALIRLAVHLPDQQGIYFDAENMEDLEQRLERNSTLMAWFKLNQVDENAREFFLSRNSRALCF